MLYTDIQGLVSVCKGYMPADLMGCEVVPSEMVHPVSQEVVKINKIKLANHEYDIGWLMDSDSAMCLGCGEEFGYFTSKHHCRLCGLIFCDDCTTYKYEIPCLAEVEGSRVCSNCFIKATNEKEENQTASDENDSHTPTQTENNPEYHSSPRLNNPLKTNHDFFHVENYDHDHEQTRTDRSATDADRMKAFVVPNVRSSAVKGRRQSNAEDLPPSKQLANAAAQLENEE
jgi:hypothetical protein